MSQVKFPAKDDALNKESAINLILASIAMEEAGLSHVLNAEGEKIQYVVGTLAGTAPPDLATIGQLAQVNASVVETMENVNLTQMMLNTKLNNALQHSTMAGPPGQPGPPGLPYYAGARPILSYDAPFFPKFIEENATLAIGEPYTATETGLLYVIPPYAYLSDQPLPGYTVIDNELTLFNGFFNTIVDYVTPGNTIHYSINRQADTLPASPIYYENLNHIETNLWFVPLV